MIKPGMRVRVVGDATGPFYDHVGVVQECSAQEMGYCRVMFP